MRALHFCIAVERFMIENDFNSLVPAQTYSRRGFVNTSVGASVGVGFAASVLPVSAQTITTDSTGLTAGEVTLPQAKPICRWCW
jgi:carboxymethylenebutenolidase